MENDRRNSQQQEELIKSLDNQNNEDLPFDNLLSKIQNLKQQKRDKKSSLTNSPQHCFSLSNYKIDPIVKDIKLKNILEMLEPNCFTFSFTKLFCEQEAEKTFHKNNLNTNNNNVYLHPSFSKYNSLFQEIANFNNKNKEKKGNRSSLKFQAKINKKILPLNNKKLMANKKNLVSSPEDEKNNNEYYIQKIKANNTIELNLNTINKKENLSKYNTLYNNVFYTEKMDNFNKKLSNSAMTENNIDLLQKNRSKETKNLTLKQGQTIKSKRDVFIKGKKAFIIRDPNIFRSISVW